MPTPPPLPSCLDKKNQSITIHVITISIMVSHVSVNPLQSIEYVNVSRHNSSFSKFFRRLRVLTASVKKWIFVIKNKRVVSQLDKSIYTLFAIIDSEAETMLLLMGGREGNGRKGY